MILILKIKNDFENQNNVFDFDLKIIFLAMISKLFENNNLSDDNDFQNNFPKSCTE